MTQDAIFAWLQVLVTAIVLGVWAFLIVTRQSVPPEVYTLVGAVVGFFFQNTARTIRQEIAKMLLRK